MEVLKLRGLGHWYHAMDLRRRGRILLAASVLCGICAAWLVNRQITSLEQALGTTVPVLIAKEDIMTDKVLTEAMVTFREIPLRFVMPGMIPATDLKDVMSAKAIVTVKQGEIITQNSFETRTSDGTPRTYLMESSANVVFGGLQQGDRVDILVAYHADDTDRAEILLRDIPVLGVSVTDQHQDVTLSLSVAQAEKLAWYENYGKQIRLLKR